MEAYYSVQEQTSDEDRRNVGNDKKKVGPKRWNSQKPRNYRGTMDTSSTLHPGKTTSL